MEGRLPNWSDSEKLSVIRLINDQYSGLFEKFKGGMGYKKKEGLWQSIADEFNSSGVAQCRRSVDSIKTMFKNTKARAKQKDGEKRKTGGGPAVNLSLSEEEAIRLIKDKPQMQGIQGGLDSSSDKESTVEKGKESEVQEQTGDSANFSQPSLPGNSNALSTPALQTFVETISHEDSNISNSKASGNKGTKRKRTEAHDALYTVELERANLEVQLLKQRLSTELELFKLRRQILENNLKQTLDNGFLNIEM